MSKSNFAPTHWKRPRTRTYDYNYNVGEHYYTPQLNYLETKRAGRAQTPPSAKSFAERFVENPVYGRYNWSASAASASNAEASNSESVNTDKERTLIDRYGSLDDLGLLERRNKNVEESSSSLRAQESSNVIIGKSVSSSSSSSRRLKFTLGDRLLNAAGVEEEALSPKPASREAEDPLDTFLARRKNRSLGVVQSAEAELVTEDPFKTRNNAALVAAKKRADDLIQELHKETESSASRFRARLKAKTQEQEQVSSEGEYVSRADQIREKAKARLALLETSFPDLAIGSEAVARRAAVDEDFGNEFASSRFGTSSISSKSITITKRTVKATVESG